MAYIITGYEKYVGTGKEWQEMKNMSEQEKKVYRK